MLRGLTTVSFFATDLEEAKRWYAELLGIQPYYEVPGYIEFRVGDYAHELGFIDARYAPHPAQATATGSVTYWHVDDVWAGWERLLAMGATEHHPPTERGEGFVTASVLDPFGNIVGIMANPHYLEVLHGLSGPS